MGDAPGDLAVDLAADGPARRLWDSLPQRAFVRLDRTVALRRDHVLVALKTRELVHDVEVRSMPVGAFAFARLSLVTCGTVPCAYVIATSGCRMRMRSTHCSWSVRGDPAATPRPLFTDGTLGLMGDEAALVAFVHASHWLA